MRGGPSCDGCGIDLVHRLNHDAIAFREHFIRLLCCTCAQRQAEALFKQLGIEIPKDEEPGE